MIFNLCTQRDDNCTIEHCKIELYKRYGETFENYQRNKVLPAIRGKTGVSLLKEFKERWENHEVYTKWMANFFAYLNRYYVAQNSRDPLAVKSNKIFHQMVLDEQREAIRKAFLSCMSEDREGVFDGDDTMLSDITRMLVKLGRGSMSVYESELENYVLKDTVIYYKKKAAEWLATKSFSSYLGHAERAINGERDRCLKYLDGTTSSRIHDVCVDVLLNKPQKALLEKDTSVAFLLKQNDFDGLKKAYILFSLVEEGLQQVADVFKIHIINKVIEITELKLPHLTLEALKAKEGASAAAFIHDKTIGSLSNDPSFILAMMELLAHLRHIVSECFMNTFPFQKALREAFETVVNINIGKYPYAFILATYSDRLMKGGNSNGGGDEKEGEEQLAKLTELFSFLSDKDIFADMYRYFLGRRLINKNSFSEYFEKSMIAKLKLKCGAPFTSKLEGMLADVNTACDVNKQFQLDSQKKYGQDIEQVLGLDFNSQVLTTGFWPTYPTTTLVVPKAIVKCLQVFQEYYTETAKHRRLTWIHSLGSVVLTREFVKRHDVYCSPYQASVLMLFNEHPPKKTLSEIYSDLQIEEAEARKLIETAVFSKFKVLTKLSAGKSVQKDDAFIVNEEFSFPNRKIKLPQPIVEDNTPKGQIEVDRSHNIDATIVRVMKARKVLDHNILMAEVVSLLTNFKPNPKTIKSRIEFLIDKDYLAREEKGQGKVYKYCA
eukprot:GHVO01014575.1.p1 GENE.GHVO01014575.1~~GHVO01014575.1.p1  ORF type:complete len:719 (-),score=80.28 GHVO01014575.1:236-2392(-)